MCIYICKYSNKFRAALIYAKLMVSKGIHIDANMCDTVVQNVTNHKYSRVELRVDPHLQGLPEEEKCLWEFML